MISNRCELAACCSKAMCLWERINTLLLDSFKNLHTSQSLQVMRILSIFFISALD